MKRLMSFATGVVAAGCLSAAALGGSPGVEWITTVNEFTNGAWTLGWEFQANSNVNVTGLGYFQAAGAGWGTSHEVGLWDISGNLLAQATVTSADAQIGHFRYVAITPVALTAGDSYVVGGASHNDLYSYDNTGFTVNPDITYIQDRYISGDPLTFPTNTTGGGNVGFFGGNILLQPIPAPGAVVLLALAGVASRRRRRA